MDPKRFEIEISFTQTVRYRIEARDRKAAEREALQQWRAGTSPEPGSTECCQLMGVSVHDLPDEDRQARDCDTAYRYLRDRELVIEALDRDAFNPTVHDAVSAEDVASHLGWKRKDGGALDVARASRALDQLCAHRRVVCFTRPRARADERGDLRLYCTPQHLELLSAMVTDLELPEAAVAS